MHLKEINLKMLENTLVDCHLLFSMDACTHVELIMTDTASLIHNNCGNVKRKYILSVRII